MHADGRFAMPGMLGPRAPFGPSVTEIFGIPTRSTATVDHRSSPAVSDGLLVERQRPDERVDVGHAAHLAWIVTCWGGVPSAVTVSVIVPAPWGRTTAIARPWKVVHDEPANGSSGTGFALAEPLQRRRPVELDRHQPVGGGPDRAGVVDQRDLDEGEVVGSAAIIAAVDEQRQTDVAGRRVQARTADLLAAPPGDRFDAPRP